MIHDLFNDSYAKMGQRKRLYLNRLNYAKMEYREPLIIRILDEI